MYVLSSEFGPEGSSLALDEETDLNEVPDSHRHLLTKNIRAVLEDPLAYMADLARQSTHSGLTQLLTCFSNCVNEWQLELHHLSPEEFPHRPDGMSAVYLRFFPDDLDIAPGLVLLSPDLLGKEDRLPKGIHPAIQHLYSLIDGTNETGFLLGGGLFTGGPTSTLAESGFGFNEDAIDGSQFYPFATTFDGQSYLAGLDGKVYMMAAGGDCVKSAGDGDAWLSAYCEAQLAGKDITSFFEDQY